MFQSNEFRNKQKIFLLSDTNIFACYLATQQYSFMIYFVRYERWNNVVCTSMKRSKKQF